MSKPDTFSADRIMNALASKHADAVFVPECKNGPTQQGSHRRLDAWVLLKTWSPVTTIGYEVKVSRSDWRRDEKLQEYAGLCHLLYVVAPKGIVPLDEVPATWGLIEVCGPTDRLVTRRRAERREISLPESLMVYVLMCRAVIKSETPYEPFDRRKMIEQELREWAQQKDERRAMSYAISTKIREQFDAQERAIEENKRKTAALEDIRQRIVELGFDPTQPVNSWLVNERLNQIAGSIPDFTISDLGHTATRLLAVQERLKQLKDNASLVHSERV